MPDLIKQNGIHYTPENLAAFLAQRTLLAYGKSSKSISVVDPACGDGNLLVAIAQNAKPSVRRRMQLFGFERDPDAASNAQANLSNLGVASVTIVKHDFLDVVKKDDGFRYDIVIANPPYVRTQVLGSREAQSLAKRFGLSGRVDLYHAFSIAMASVLRDGGTLGLLTSNRFLTIKSGVKLRTYLREHFDIAEVIDLGDTKLFSASVLPVVVAAQKKSDNGGKFHDEAPFTRIYECRSHTELEEETATTCDVLDGVSDPTVAGKLRTEQGVYEIERGRLAIGQDDAIWTLATPQSNAWLKTVERYQVAKFSDVANIRVGIKTTADAVFIRERWDDLDKASRPERKLIHPLITHHDAERWSIDGTPIRKSVLYPHQLRDGRREAIRLEDFPRAAAYFDSHRERLEGRSYVTESGRNWYEIWVPHRPTDWTEPKIVFPDISERPTFFLDRSTAIVNGDCYWITLKNGYPEDWLYLILAIANSTFITDYYDHRFHNKLYAGRRRFMTQYVKQFPLPDLKCDDSRQIIRLTKKILAAKRPSTRSRLESESDVLVRQAFGVD
ncbi:Modification methylase PaeR7I [Rubripirellula amarantea]|uniref:site-specific DNA-methyltransferase (adenine-specific) n=1 Tax=Rubripirellula amarantea TaxID=2527999 RepID=A0A5C5WV69_9BACT|nr:N-6 DNA methylase [Rubripirellula amarantea]TWT54508.1 Modification methylase PaeR7I [Rubripirellula amarantea]